MEITDIINFPLSDYPEIYGHRNNSDLLLGIVNGPGSPILVAARPVIDNVNTEFVAGTLVIGRIMNDYFFDEMEEQISVSIDVWDLEQQLPEDVKVINQNMKDEDREIIYVADEQQLHTYFNQYDIYGQPTLLAKIEVPRRISGIGNATLNSAVTLLIFSLLLFILGFWIIFGKLILAPISALNTHINRMREDDDLSQHVVLDSKDEFGEMAREFNALTDQLLESRRESEAAKQTAIAASESKSSFLATMSHEIRTPMNGVLGMAELLLRTRPMSTEQQHYAKTISHSGRSLLTILNDILDFSKIESGKLSLERVEFSIRETVEDILELVAHQAQEKGLELILDVPPELQGLRAGDVGRIRQMLLNLLTNAVKFTESGHICLRLTIERSSKEKQLVRFEVEDTGIGIEEANQSKLFNAFTQEDDSTTRRFGGTGLGLAVTRQLAELMGGEADFSSTHGVGSTFWLRLPLQIVASSAKSQKGSFQGSSAILYLSNQLNSCVIKKQLEYWGVEVHEVDHGDRVAAAIDTIQASSEPPPILLLVDKQLLDKYTSSLIGTLLQVRVDAKLKLVVLCPLESAMSESESNRLGMPAVVNKPVRLEFLRECIESFLNPSASNENVETELEAEEDGDSAVNIHRVLLVEDNTVNVMVAENMLKKLSCEVTTANNGAEAVELCSKENFDVVLMDCSMPVMDGYEATRKIREVEAAGNVERVTIVALTANAMADDRERCLKAGMDDFLSKPISMDELSVKLQQLN